MPAGITVTHPRPIVSLTPPTINKQIQPPAPGKTNLSFAGLVGSTSQQQDHQLQPISMYQSKLFGRPSSRTSLKSESENFGL
jgi:hypothetical protein